MPLIAFDMEIATPVADEADLLAGRPGIACAAFIREGDTRPLVLFDPATSPDLFVPATRALTQEGATRILEALIAADDRGDTILTWNGASFDFRLLADETGRHADCVRLARRSVDMMFQVLCEKGHPLALDSALKGMGLQSKVDAVALADGRSAPIDGGLAPVLWQAGEYEAVMTYCGGDVAATLALAIACRQKRRLTWISRAGRTNHLPLGGRWKTVEECLALPEPDTSWMKDPMRREVVLAWMAGPGLSSGAPARTG